MRDSIIGFLNIFLFALLCCVLSGCFQQTYDPNEDLRTVPVTNNPQIVPNYGSAMPNAF